MGAKFKKVRKTSEPYYILPTALAEKTGIVNISESGICFFGKENYSKAYMINETKKKDASAIEKIKGSMMVLRGYDVPFKYFEDDNGDVILDINVTAKDFEEAKNIIEHLENDMKSNLYTFGIIISAMDLQDRLRFYHRKIMNEIKDARIDVNDYLKNTSWPSDIDYKRFKESKSYLKTDTGVKGYFYVRKMPSENVGTVYETIRLQSSVTDMMTVYEPISDLDMYKKIREMYDDVENEEPPVTDERRNVMGGIYFSIVGTEETVERDFNKLKEAVYPYGCELSPFYYKQFEVFKAFATFAVAEIKQLRTISVSNAVKATPFNPETKKEEGANALLSAFDTLMSRSNEV